jgi:hypothetical protein
MLNRPAARASWRGTAHLLACALLCVVVFPWPHRADLPAAEGTRSNDLKAIETPEVLLGRALARPARFEFIETPLNDVLEFLKDEHEVPITLDKRALEDEGIDAATPINMNVANVSLKAGLEMMLEPLALTWVIRKEVLTITTVVQAESWLETRIYDVRDLLLAEGEPFVDESMACSSRRCPRPRSARSKRCWPSCGTSGGSRLRTKSGPWASPRRIPGWCGSIDSPRCAAGRCSRPTPRGSPFHLPRNRPPRMATRGAQRRAWNRLPTRPTPGLRPATAWNWPR